MSDNNSTLQSDTPPVSRPTERKIFHPKMQVTKMGLVYTSLLYLHM